MEVIDEDEGGGIIYEPGDDEGINDDVKKDVVDSGEGTGGIKDKDNPPSLPL